MNQALFASWVNRIISHEEAMGRSTDQKELETMISKSGLNGAERPGMSGRGPQLERKVG
jgi:hypothetical protein